MVDYNLDTIVLYVKILKQIQLHAITYLAKNVILLMATTEININVCCYHIYLILFFYIHTYIIFE